MSDVVEIIPDGTVRRLTLVRRDGRRLNVDLRPFAARGGALAVLDDAGTVAAARLIDHGAAVAWPGGVEIAVVTLLAAATPHTAAAE